MKNKLLTALIFGYSFLFVIACEASCADIKEYVGRREQIIIIVSDSGGPDDYVTSDAAGYATHPCGTSIGSGEYRQ